MNISPITGQKPSGRVASPTLKVDGAIKTNRGQVSSAKDGAVFLVPAPAKSTDGSFDVKTSPTLTADGAIKTNRGKGSPAKDDPIFLVPAPAKSADGAFKAKEKSTPSKAIAPVSPMSRSDRDIDNFSMDGTSEFGNFPDDFDDDSTLDDFDENISMISVSTKAKYYSIEQKLFIIIFFVFRMFLRLVATVENPQMAQTRRELIERIIEVHLHPNRNFNL